MDEFESPDAHDRPDQPADGDAIDHLWNAAHEMLRAMRTLVDAADEFVETQRAERPASRAAGAPGAREGRVHHINIDLGSERGRSTDTDTDADLGSSAGAS
jgi:hypothetical protein